MQIKRIALGGIIMTVIMFTPTYACVGTSDGIDRRQSIGSSVFGSVYTKREHKEPGRVLCFLCMVCGQGSWKGCKVSVLYTGRAAINNAAASAMGSYQDCIKGAPPFRRRYFGCSVTTPFYLMLMEH